MLQLRQLLLALVLAPASIESRLAVAEGDPDAASSAPVFFFEDHGEAMFGWSEALRRRGDVLFAALPMTLVHFDSHGDMDLPGKVLQPNMSSLELAQHVGINDFIVPAVGLGWLDRIVWIRPKWAVELNYGNFSTVVAEDEATGRYVTTDFFTTHWSHDAVGFLVREEEEVLRAKNPRRFTIEVLKFEVGALKSIDFGGRPFLLDIDLDVFATENFGAQLLRTRGFTSDEILTYEVNICSFEVDEDSAKEGESEGEEEEALGNIVNRVNDRLSDGDLDEVQEMICAAPVKYSTKDEVAVAEGLLLDWLSSLRRSMGEREGGAAGAPGAAGAGLPGVVTVSSSVNGYLPRSYLGHLKDLPKRVASILGLGEPEWIPCSRCVTVSVKNDLGVALEHFYQDDSRPAGIVVPLDNIEPNESSAVDSYIDHIFFFRTAEEPPRLFRLELVPGDGDASTNGSTRCMDLLASRLEPTTERIRLRSEAPDDEDEDEEVDADEGARDEERTEL